MRFQAVDTTQQSRMVTLLMRGFGVPVKDLACLLDRVRGLLFCGLKVPVENLVAQVQRRLLVPDERGADAHGVLLQPGRR